MSCAFVDRQHRTATIRSMRLLNDFSLSTLSAGFVAALVGFTSSVAIVFQAAQAFQATPEQLASWMWALCLGMGLCTLLPSWWLRKPVMVAWSTPGAAVLASAGLAGGFSMAEALGAFMVCAALMTLCGATGWFERAMNHIPMALAAALLAGVLARFGLLAVSAAQSALALVLLMLGAYLVARRAAPRYAVPLALAVALAYAGANGQLTGLHIDLAFTAPVFVMPSFTWAAAVSLALPLFVVTMASQNLPGVAAIRATGYGGPQGIPVSRVLTLTGLATLLLAPFGAFALNLSAITAAICMGPQAHTDPARRYTAAMANGAIYVLLGLFGAALSALLLAFPKELVAAIAGIALLGAIGNALATALQDEGQREAATITFLVTLSGVVLAGVGSAFWGLLAGALALWTQQFRLKRD
jgi:benzoate membrane transport protein